MYILSSLHNLCGGIAKRPLSDISLSCVEAEIRIYDMGKTRIKCYDMMICSEDLILKGWGLST